MSRIAVIFLILVSLLVPTAHADVPPEALREELAEMQGIFGLEDPVRSDSELYHSTLNDPWLGYRVIVIVDKSAAGTSETAQSLFVFLYDERARSFYHFTTWKTSTGLETPYTKNGKTISSRVTPEGFYRLEYRQVDYVSFKYGEPMPYSLFYWRDFGVAIHATAKTKYNLLGQRASMGCTRLTLENAKLLYEHVDSYGYGAVAKLDRQTGALVQGRGGPLVVKGYPLFVVNTAPGQPGSAIKIRPSDYVERPEALIELFQSGR